MKNNPTRRSFLQRVTAACMLVVTTPLAWPRKVKGVEVGATKVFPEDPKERWDQVYTWNGREWVRTEWTEGVTVCP